MPEVRKQHLSGKYLGNEAHLLVLTIFLLATGSSDKTLYSRLTSGSNPMDSVVLEHAQCGTGLRVRVETVDCQDWTLTCHNIATKKIVVTCVV